MTLYALKPRFQALLRPLARRLARAGVTANQVTLAAALGSLVTGVLVAGIVAVAPGAQEIFLLIPLWLALRMAMNALDGMLARDFAQQTPLGAYLNELADVVSDAALMLPFALLAPFEPMAVAAVVFLAVLSEFAGVLGPLVGAARRYEGPLGKSDRALVFGGLGLAAALLPALPLWLGWLMPALALLLCLTVLRRVRAGLAELNTQGSGR
ncbi:CDP-alcohol phosphatidyltransferase family protein [Pelagibius sp.]|uniref:CDP-alcohol phosphatidyltransferase family protein n=1 Tax=Pelagibius sp. TaxID=1931238 RepID=UPI0026361897|nr:CDP-alcohol phosphatidyltransferase family protein [Pelagibius sp.]